MEISVSDQGQGIPEGELHKLFTDFGQTSTCPTAGEKSTGLGLGIVKRMVEILWWAGMGGKQGRDRVKVHVYPHHRRASANKIAPAPHGLTVLVKLIEFESKTTPHVTPVAPTKSCLTQPGGPTRGTPVAPEASCTANPTDDCVRWRAAYAAGRAGGQYGKFRSGHHGMRQSCSSHHAISISLQKISTGGGVPIWARKSLRLSGPQQRFLPHGIRTTPHRPKPRSASPIMAPNRPA